MLELKSRIWVNQQGESFLGEGRVRLLEAILKHGSITKASQEVKISYKKAWKLIDSINEVSQEPVVTRVVGGKGGGGTQVTEKGKRLILEFRGVQERLKSYVDKETIRLNSLLINE